MAYYYNFFLTAPGKLGYEMEKRESDDQIRSIDRLSHWRSDP